MRSTLLSPLPLLLLAKTVIAGCTTHSFTTCDDGIVHWFDPGTGEVCDPHDCGGGRAPAREDVPGCPRYTGTEIYSKTTSYLSCWTPPASASSRVPSASVGVSTATGTGAATGGTGSPSTTTTPATTQPPTSKTGGGVTLSSSGASLATPTTNAANLLDGSLMAGAGAAIGALALI